MSYTTVRGSETQDRARGISVKGGGSTVGDRGVKDTRRTRTQPTESTEQG